MISRGVAFLGLVALSPAHASLIEYSLTSTISDLGGNIGVEVGDTITGGFLFDDAAAMTSSTEDPVVGYDGWATGVVSTSIYDTSFAAGSSIDGLLDSITQTPTSVPEPSTLSLLAAGALGAFAARRRRRAADA